MSLSIAIWGWGGGLRKLREEIEAENTGVRVPAEIRWLGGAKVRARFQREGCGSSSVVAAVLSEEVFNQLCKRGVRLPGAATRSILLRKSDQMCCACGVGSGVISPPTASPENLSVPSAQRTTLQRTTDAQFRAVGWEEAGCAHTLRRSAQTVEVLMVQGRMPALPGRSPSMQRGGGGHRPHHGGSRGGRLQRPRPRPPREGSRASRRPRWRRWEERSRGHGGVVDLCLVFLFVSCPLCLGVKVLFSLFFLFVGLLFGGSGEKEML